MLPFFSSENSSYEKRSLGIPWISTVGSSFNPRKSGSLDFSVRKSNRETGNLGWAEEANRMGGHSHSAVDIDPGIESSK